MLCGEFETFPPEPATPPRAICIRQRHDMIKSAAATKKLEHEVLMPTGFISPQVLGRPTERGLGGPPRV